MPTVINCPACNKETYKELPKCPHCGEVFRPDLIVEESREPYEFGGINSSGIKWLDDYERGFSGGLWPVGHGSEILLLAFMVFGIGTAIWQLLFEFGFLESGPFG